MVSEFSKKDVADTSGYNSKTINKDFILKWKILQETDQIRMLMKVVIM